MRYGFSVSSSNTMFTMRRKECNNSGSAKADKHQRRASAIGIGAGAAAGSESGKTYGGAADGSGFCYADVESRGHQKEGQQQQKRPQHSRNSLLIGSGSVSNDENLIHFKLGPGCFRELRRSNNGQGSLYSLAIYNLICSLLVFALRVLNNNSNNNNNGGNNQGRGGIFHTRKHSFAAAGGGPPDSHQQQQQKQLPVTVLLEAPKVPLKALRIVLRACQAALAYRIRQCVLLEPDSFLGFQQRVAKDLLLLDAYDFKILLCPRQKLAKHIGLAALYDLQQFWRQPEATNSMTGCGFPMMQNDWTDLKKGFLNFFSANPSYFANSPSACAYVMDQQNGGGLPASLSHFKRKDRTVLIELVEFDLDLVGSTNINCILPNPPQHQQQLTHHQTMPLTMPLNSRQNRRTESMKTLVIEEEEQQRSTENSKTAESAKGESAKTESAKTESAKGESAKRSKEQQRQQQPLPLTLTRQFHRQKPLSNEEAGKKCGDENNNFNGKHGHEIVGQLIKEGKAGKAEVLNKELIKAKAEVPGEAEIALLIKQTQKLLGWLGQHGERRLARLETEAATEWTFPSSLITNPADLDKLHLAILDLTKETEKTAHDLITIKEQLDGLERQRVAGGDHQRTPRPKEWIAAGQLVQGAEQRVKALRQGLGRLAERVESAKAFGMAASKLHSEASQLLLKLCSAQSTDDSTHQFHPVAGSLNADRIKEKIAELKENLEKIEKCAKLVTEASANLQRTSMLLMSQPSMDGISGRFGGGGNVTKNTSSSSSLAEHRQRLQERIAAELATIEQRRCRCQALVELHIGRLNQRLEIIKCEQFGHQILERFNSSLKSNDTKVIEELLNGRRNGKRLVDYARQMASLSCQLRKINRLEPASSELFAQRLESAWRMLERKYGESVTTGNGKWQ